MRFVHTADWQLGKPFGTIEDHEKRGLVKEERFRAVERIGEVVREHDAAFVVVAGDLFDSTTPDRSTVSKACQAIGSLGVPVLVIPGNHDHGGPGSIWEQEFFLKERDALAPNLEVLLEPEPFELEGAVILPCPLLFKSTFEDPALWLRSFDYSSLPSGKPRVVLAHGSVYDFSGFEGEGATNLLDLDALPMNEIDHIALGDWHGTTQVGPKAWYPGTPEPDGFPRGEEYRSGNVLVVEVARGDNPRVEPVLTAGFRWHTLSFSFTEETLLEELESLLEETFGGHESRSLGKVTLDGRLGIDAMHRLGKMEEQWRARLLDLRWDDQGVQIAPTQEELGSLTGMSEDPLIAAVASSLLEMMQQGEDAEVARVALQELYAACAGEVAQ